jgi:hypothetical protein
VISQTSCSLLSKSDSIAPTLVNLLWGLLESMLQSVALIGSNYSPQSSQQR